MRKPWWHPHIYSIFGFNCQIHNYKMGKRNKIKKQASITHRNLDKDIDDGGRIDSRKRKGNRH